MSVEANKNAARRYNEEVWGKGNLDVIDEVFADNYRYLNPPPQMRPTKEGFKEWVRYFRSAFNVLGTTVDDIVADGDKVAVRWTTRIRHGGEAFGIPATNKETTLSRIHILRFENGKVVEEWAEADRLGMMQRLGVIPGRFF